MSGTGCPGPSETFSHNIHSKGGFYKFYNWRSTDDDDRDYSTTVYFDVKCSKPRSAHLLFGENNDQTMDDKYNIGIGTGSNKQSKIFKSGNAKATKLHSPLQNTRYTGFWISVDKLKDGKVRIDVGGEGSAPFLTWTDPVADVKIRYLGVRSCCSETCFFSNIKQHRANLNGKFIHCFK